MPGKPYRVVLFGKTNCEKCKLLGQRLDRMLGEPEWQDFEKEVLYLDRDEEALVTFAEAECVNPQRIPAMLVMRRGESGDEFAPLPNRFPGARDPVCGETRLWHLLGLQTDYGPAGTGVITPKMIAAVLSEART